MECVSCHVKGCLHFEGLFGQHNAKKPKMLRQSLENSFENNAPIGGSIPSPVASQMSNMSNPNKLIRMLSGRDRNRKAKTLKVLKFISATISFLLSILPICLHGCRFGGLAD